ncbi:MAG: DUF3365 domain-containing protein [Flavobacteriales bacterium]|nr:DUF3365 domain-containing protein [Flavobacteriales bacterium]
MFKLIYISLYLSCGKNSPSIVSIVPDSLYVQRGDSIAVATFDTLSKTLEYVIKNSGPDSAVRYCNVHAYPITAQYATKHIHVRRTSLKFRNPANEPDVMEYLILNEFKTQQQAGLELKPVIRKDNKGIVHYFKPILIQGMCITCHGDPASDIPGSVINQLSVLYPKDQATGYHIGDLRGIWHIQFIP